MLARHIVGCFFYIGVGGLLFLGINHADSAYLLDASLSALALISVEDHYRPTFLKGGIIAQTAHHHITGAGKVALALLSQTVTAEDEVISVHDDEILAAGSEPFRSARLFLRSSGVFHPLGNLTGLYPSVGALEDAHKLTVLLDGAAIALPRSNPDALRGLVPVRRGTGGGNMHQRVCLVPGHGVARAALAKHRACGVALVKQRVVSRGGNYFRGVVAGGVFAHRHRYSSLSASEGTELRGVGAHSVDGATARNRRTVAVKLGRVHTAVHIGNIVHYPAEIIPRRVYFEIKGGLQQHRLTLHQALPDGAIGRLTEVAALGMLKMRSACGESDAHVGKRRTRKHAAMDALLQMSLYQPLPIQRQSIGGTLAGNHYARACLQRRYAQVHLCILAQRLKVTCTLHRCRHGFLVKYRSAVKGHRKPEAVGDYTRQHLGLYLAHQPDPYLAGGVVVSKTQRGVLLRKDEQAHIGFIGVGSLWQYHTVAEHGGQALLAGQLRTESHAGGGGT